MSTLSPGIFHPDRNYLAFSAFFHDLKEGIVAPFDSIYVDCDPDLGLPPQLNHPQQIFLVSRGLVLNGFDVDVTVYFKRQEVDSWHVRISKGEGVFSYEMSIRERREHYQLQDLCRLITKNGLREFEKNVTGMEFEDFLNWLDKKIAPI